MCPEPNNRYSNYRYELNYAQQAGASRVWLTLWSVFRMRSTSTWTQRPLRSALTRPGASVTGSASSAERTSWPTTCRRFVQPLLFVEDCLLVLNSIPTLAVSINSTIELYVYFFCVGPMSGKPILHNFNYIIIFNNIILHSKYLLRTQTRIQCLHTHWVWQS